MTLIASSPEIDFLYKHQKDNLYYVLDTAKIKTQLGDIPINTPAVMRFIQKHIRDGLRKVSA